MSGVKLFFAHDTDHALQIGTALVNTCRGDDELLPDEGVLAEFLDEYEFTGRRDGTLEELRAVRALRPRLRAVWDAPDEAAAVAQVNDLLERTRATPRLTRHGNWDWHLHVSKNDDALADRLGAEAAMGLVDVIRVGGLDRLRRCAAPDCDAVLVDLSRNRSRRYCDTGNCGNRLNVAAYRARKREA
jgi:predicted RNA-binding Zn ribbon-like protein